MGYLADFVSYNAGDECPEQFRVWSALSLLGAVLGRKVWYMHGKFPVHPTIYVALIGTAGSGKSTARGETKRLFIENFPVMLTSASIQSREDIIKKMGSPEALRTWRLTPNDPIEEYRAFYIIANELGAFVSVDARKMLDFLVDVFDENWYSTGFKSTESQDFKNPSVSILACGTPDWVMQNMRLDLIKGGIGRRLILVPGEKKDLVAFPSSPTGWETAKSRVVEHLKDAFNLCGEVKATPAARLWWKSWYENWSNHRNDDPILNQFYQTKFYILLKVALLISVDERPFKMQMTDVHMQQAEALLNQNEEPIRQLTSGVGRNELAAISQQLMEHLRLHDGMGQEKKLRIMFARNVREQEWREIVTHLMQTEQIVAQAYGSNGGMPKYFYFLPERWAEIEREIKDRTKANPFPPSPCPPGATT